MTYNNYVTIQDESINKYGGRLEAIWSVAKNEGSLHRCIEIITETPEVSNKDLAEQISDEFQLNWSKGSKIRNGGILSQWSRWIKEGIETSSIPIPPGRSNKNV